MSNVRPIASLFLVTLAKKFVKGPKALIQVCVGTTDHKKNLRLGSSKTAVSRNLLASFARTQSLSSLVIQGPVPTYTCMNPFILNE